MSRRSPFQAYATLFPERSSRKWKPDVQSDGRYLGLSCSQMRITSRAFASARISPFDLGDMSHKAKSIDAVDEFGILGRVFWRYVMGH